jgi:membrane associated rhomboid family serine protease
MYGSYIKRKKPGMPWGAIIFGGLAFVVQLARWRWPELLGADWLNQWGVVPVRLFASLTASNHWWQSSEIPTLGSALLIHVGFGHLIGNLVFLWLFAQRVEQRLGWVFSLGMYLLAGIVANFCAAWQVPDSASPIVGNSGVTSALLGAFLVLFPRSRIGVIVPLGLYLQLIRVPAILLIGSWVGLQLMYTFFIPGLGAVAWWTHLAGFTTGLLVAAPARWYRKGRN